MADPRSDRGRRGVEVLREVVLTGVAVIVPSVISAYVLVVLFGVIQRVLRPVSSYFVGESTLVGQLLALASLVALVLVVGFVAHFRRGKRAIDYFDAAVARVPGIGTVYRSFRRMSDIMLESDADHFREVKLLSFPGEHTYALGFETARNPEGVVDAVDAEEVVTLFVPLAPNPVMGGFVVHVPAERVRDVDLTVEEGIQATVTSGVALGGGGAGSFAGTTWELPDIEGARSLTLRDLRRLDVEEIRELDAEDLRELDAAAIENRLFREEDQ